MSSRIIVDVMLCLLIAMEVEVDEDAQMSSSLADTLATSTNHKSNEAKGPCKRSGQPRLSQGHLRLDSTSSGFSPLAISLRQASCLRLVLQ
jgi:hypothetical protein